MKQIHAALFGGLFLLSSCTEPGAQNHLGLEFEEWEVRPLSTDARFVAVRDIASVGDFLWILDSAPPFLSRISIGSGEVLQFGLEGEGPGEFLAPWAIQPTADSSSILVWDFGSYRTTEFDLSGSVKASQPMSQTGRIRARSRFKQTSYADPFRVRSVPGGFLAGSFDRRLDHTADFSRGVIRLTGQDLDLGQQVVGMADLVERGVEGLKEWSSIPFWDVCADGLVVWRPSSGEVVRFGPDLKPRGNKAVEIPRGEVQDQDIERYLEWMARLEIGPEYDTHGIDFGVMARQFRDRFAADRPAVTDLRCQGGNTLWLRLFSTNNDPLGKGDVWLLAPRDGPIRKVRTPIGFTPFLFRPEGPIGSSRLPGGDEIVVQLSPPTSPLSSSH